MPEKLQFTCVTKFSEDLVIVTGLTYNYINGGNKIVTYVYNVTRNEFRKGPDLTTSRMGHLCATFIHEDQNHVIVIGGDTSGSGTTSEIWNPNSGINWKPGSYFYQKWLIQ